MMAVLLVLVALLSLGNIGCAVLLLRRRGDDSASAELARGLDRLERAVRDEVSRAGEGLAAAAGAGREEGVVLANAAIATLDGRISEVSLGLDRVTEAVAEAARAESDRLCEQFAADRQTHADTAHATAETLERGALRLVDAASAGVEAVRAAAEAGLSSVLQASMREREQMRLEADAAARKVRDEVATSFRILGESAGKAIERGAAQHLEPLTRELEVSLQSHHQLGDAIRRVVETAMSGVRADLAAILLPEPRHADLSALLEAERERARAALEAALETHRGWLATIHANLDAAIADLRARSCTGGVDALREALATLAGRVELADAAHRSQIDELGATVAALTRGLEHQSARFAKTLDERLRGISAAGSQDLELL